MPAVSEFSLLMVFAVVQVLGLMSLVGARMPRHAASQSLFRGLFLFCLVAVGLTTMCAVGCGSGWWLSCGATLSVMAVGGTIDLGHTAGAAI